MHYDHIAFHYDDQFPTDLPQQHAIHHMGFYFAWAVSQKLHNPAWESHEDFAKLQQQQISGSEFMWANMGAELTDEDFNELGNWFSQFYYHDEEDGYGLFMEDYFVALEIDDAAHFYHVADHADTQAKLNPVFQAAFEKWLASLKETPHE